MKREMGGKVATGDSGGARAGADRGFTLVELLVVMGIIAILVSLLFPAITGVIVAVRKAATANVINNLGVALDAFRTDWGVYPPSDKTHDTLNGAADATQSNCGYYNLFFCLTGPNRKGWGLSNPDLATNNNGPFGGTCTEVKPPYFLPDKASDTMWYDATVNLNQWCYADAFKPGRPIYYYRFEPTEDPAYDVTDNPTDTSSTSPLGGFKDKAHFEMLVRPTDPSGTARWVRDDYLLISCGASRYWGYVKQTKDANGNVTVTPATASDLGVSTCDNVTNFSYSR